MKIIKTSYNAGELSEYVSGRTDYNKYYNGCSKLINATVLPHGGVVKRSGTQYIAKAPNKCNLKSFEFSVDDALILEFSNLKIRFYKNGDRIYETAKNISGATKADPVVITSTAHGYSNGDWIKIESVQGMTELNDKEYIVANVTTDTFELTDTEGNNVDGTDYDDYDSGGTCKRVYEITSPYTSEEAFEIHTTQSADVMYIAHEDHHPQKLSRNSDTDWTIEDVPFRGGPFLDENTNVNYTIRFIPDEDRYGTHDGGQNQDTLTDSSQSWDTNELVGLFVNNVTDGSIGIITANTATTVTATLTGGKENDWDTGDEYAIADNSHYFESGRAGTLVAENHEPFNENHVGSLWLLKHTRKDNSTSTFANDDNTAPENLLNAIKIKGDFTFVCDTFNSGDSAKLWRKVGNYDWQEYRTFSAATNYSATEDEDNVYYAITRSVGTINGTLTAKNQVSRGIVRITGYTDSQHVDCEVVDQLYWEGVGVDPDKSMWAEGAWSDYRGYPRSVGFYEDRLWWLSSTNNPDTLWSSKTSDYENMEYTDTGLDDDAVIMPINDNEVSQLQWMMAREVMAVGSANKEYRLSASNPDNPITPDDRKAKPQTSFGSNNIQPLILNNAIFFFQRQGRKLRAMRYDAIAEDFRAADATLLANTLLESSPTCMAIQRIPDSLVWIVRSDGVLLSFCYEPDEEVAGWSRHLTQNTVDADTAGGYFESVAVIHGDIEDEVWVSVRRVINGTTVRYIERFATRYFDQIDEAMMLDSAVVVESSFESKEIALASDTVRYGSGLYGSSLYGGTL